MMTHGIARMVCALVLVGISCAPPVDEGPEAGHSASGVLSVEEAVQDLVERWDAALSAGEAGGVVAMYVADNPAVMPPDQPAYSGPDGLSAFFDQMLAGGGLTVSNRAERVLSSGDLVIARGSYTLALTAESGNEQNENGKWTAISRRGADGSLVVLRNIWNRDAPPAGAEPPPAVDATGPAPADDAPCLHSPIDVDEAFRADFTAGNVPVLVAHHAEEGSRMPPGMPPVEGSARIGAFLQSYVDMFPERELELLDMEQEVDGNLGYAWGRYRYSYTPATGGEAVGGEGKYISVSREGTDGCWRNEWVIWNSDAPWPEAGF